jgi:hypothetical protein
MKNVTDSLKPSVETAVVTKPEIIFDKDDFTISLNDFYTGQFARSQLSAAAYMEAFDALKKEAVKRGYVIDEWTSMDTMIRYARFHRCRL